jgi:hypothetical protein
MQAHMVYPMDDVDGAAVIASYKVDKKPKVDPLSEVVPRHFDPHRFGPHEYPPLDETEISKRHDANSFNINNSEAMSKEVEHPICKEEVHAIVNRVAELVIKKNATYGGAAFINGQDGTVVHLTDKIARFKHIIKNGATDFESAADTLDDIIGYAILGHIMLNEEVADESKS